MGSTNIVEKKTAQISVKRRKDGQCANCVPSDDWWRWIAELQTEFFISEGLELAIFSIRKAITEKLDVKEVISSSGSSSNSFNIADLGCSTGPNTFVAIQNILESVLLNYKVNCTPSDEPLEFQVFFNDLAANDFNTLFNSLPSDRQYFATAVPGPFQGRLFPKASLHFVHSSYALHWLSRVPKEMVDKNSPAFNRGRIYYSSAPRAVGEAFSAQFCRDMESFLDARAQEIVNGGLMAFIILCTPDGVRVSHCSNSIAVTAFETSMLDLVKMGLISEAKVDSFNIPTYHPTQQEVKALIEANGCFNIQRIEPLARSAEKGTDQAPEWVATARALWEGLIKEHFGAEIIDQLFDRFSTRLEESLTLSSSFEKMIDLFVLVKRNINA